MAEQHRNQQQDSLHEIQSEPTQQQDQPQQYAEPATPVLQTQQTQQQVLQNFQLVLQQLLQTFWANQIQEISTEVTDYKSLAFPLARIKRVIRTDEEIRQKMMISSEVPLLLAKATEIFALELTIRAWMHTEDNKRRTLQRNDIVMAVSRSDMYDFLIDIVPRQELSKKPAAAHEAAVPASAAGPSSLPAPTPSFFPPPSGGFATTTNDPSMMAYQQQLQQFASATAAAAAANFPSTSINSVISNDGEKQ